MPKKQREFIDKKIQRCLLSEVNIKPNCKKSDELFRCVEAVTMFYPVQEEYERGSKRRDTQMLLLKRLASDIKKTKDTLASILEGVDGKPMQSGESPSDTRTFTNDIFLEIEGYLKSEIAAPKIIESIESRIREVSQKQKQEAFRWHHADYHNEPRVGSDWRQLLNLLDRAEFHIKRMRQKAFPKPRKEELNHLIYFLVHIFENYHQWGKIAESELIVYRESFVIIGIELATEKPFELTDYYKRVVSKAQKVHGQYVEIYFLDDSYWPMRYSMFPSNFKYSK